MHHVLVVRVLAALGVGSREPPAGGRMSSLRIGALVFGSNVDERIEPALLVLNRSRLVVTLPVASIHAQCRTSNNVVYTTQRKDASCEPCVYIATATWPAFARPRIGSRKFAGSVSGPRALGHSVRLRFSTRGRRSTTCRSCRSSRSDSQPDSSGRFHHERQLPRRPQRHVTLAAARLLGAH